MSTAFYHPSLLSLSAFSMSNNTSIDQMISGNDHSLHLLILTAVWIVLIITIVFGTTGNILVLYVYVSRDDNKTCTLFIKMLAIVDLIICLVLTPLELYQTTTGIRNESLCKLYGFLSTHVLYSTFLITTIAFDRYFCICWPLYKIITVNRARAIVIICGIFSSLFAIIPMSEYSTREHVLHIHNNHSEHLSLDTYDEYESAIYTHVENIKPSVVTLPFTIGNMVSVKCSPRFSLSVQLSKFLTIYRVFHSALFAICIVLVLILYSFIYKAVYQRRRTRTKKFSAYRKILHSYLINDPSHRQSTNRHSLFASICCYCCHKFHRNSAYQSASHRSCNRPNKRRYFHDEQSSATQHRPEQIVLEVNGARGKRFSATSMTSMTYVTSGVWDEAAPTHLMRSRINSTAAVSYCGVEPSSAGRPSTSTEDSFDQTNKLLAFNHSSSPFKSTLNSTHLTVPNKPTVLNNSTNDPISKEQQVNEIELSGNLSQTTNPFRRSIVRKPSRTLSMRHQRSVELPMHQRKVSFMTTSPIVDRCIIEDPPSTHLNNSSPSNQQLPTDVNNHRPLSPSSSIVDRSNSFPRHSISSARRPSAFDGEAHRIFKRQQRQERLANIRTTLTLFVVTATFILMYLPSIIITLFNIKPNEFREALFLLYYINSACNPLIYSFLILIFAMIFVVFMNAKT